MSVPTYDKFIEPILRFLAAHRSGASVREAQDAAANALHLSDSDRLELLPSGVQLVFKNRAGWAHDRLKRAGFSASPRRGYWQLTEAGLAFAQSHPAPLSDGAVEALATEHNDVRLRLSTDRPVSETAAAAPSDRATVSPDDRLEQALAELRQNVAAELLDLLSRVSPEYFETIVLDLLHKMGYGANRTDVLRVGRSNDGGIDGVISLDRLGLEKVYVQAKRWQNSVGRPEGAVRGEG